MPSLSRPDLRTRSPIAFRRPELLHAGAYLLVAASGVVEFVRIVAAGAGAAVIGALLVTVAGAALAWWRPWPGLVGAVAGCAISAALGWDPIVMWSITVFVLFSFTLQGKSPVRGTLFTVAALYVVGGIADGYRFLSLTGFPAWVSAAAGGAMGSALRIHQQYWASLEQRTADAVATRESEAIRRVAEERLRIARDLHDVVGHQVAVVSMHLGVAEVNLPADADPARAALASARTAVRSVLLETQRILNLLRRGTLDDDPAGQPAPELSRLPELVDSYRQIGLQVDATLGEMPDDIDPAVSLTAYRIVQEALTNAHRHGDGTAELSVTAADGRLLIEMVNARGRNGAGRDVGSGFRSGGCAGTGDVGRRTKFGGVQSPLVVLVSGEGVSAKLPAIEAELRGLGDVQQVSTGAVTGRDDAALVSVVPKGGPIDDGTKTLVTDIRDRADDVAAVHLDVTGETAIGIDSDAMLHSALIKYLIVIVGLSFLLLIVMFRSVLVPLIATPGYLLSVGASFGASVAVFQWGWLDSIIPAPQGDPMLSLLPIILVGVLFGLAMDYQVFLVSRIQEMYRKGLSPKEAVLSGFRKSGPVLVAAAAIMTFVFAGFASSPMAVAASIALGLVVGVMVDAFLVRMIIMPALLSLLGHSAWWLPKWLDRIVPRLDTEGHSLDRQDPAPSTEDEPVLVEVR